MGAPAGEGRSHSRGGRAGLLVGAVGHGRSWNSAAGPGERDVRPGAASAETRPGLRADRIRGRGGPRGRAPQGSFVGEIAAGRELPEPGSALCNPGPGESSHFSPGDTLRAHPGPKRRPEFRDSSVHLQRNFSPGPLGGGVALQPTNQPPGARPLSASPPRPDMLIRRRREMRLDAVCLGGVAMQM